MWRKPKITSKLLEILLADNNIDEIIIIDNDPSKAICPVNDKIKYYPQEKNIYVSASWNLGASVAKNDNLILINDDILIPKNVMDYMSNINLLDYGIIGAAGEYILQVVDSYDDWDQVPIHCKLVNSLNFGFGVMMFVHKNNYYHIPENIKIWYNDNFLFIKNILNGKTNLALKCVIKTEMSSTCSDPQFDQIKIEDEKNFAEYFKS